MLCLREAEIKKKTSHKIWHLLHDKQSQNSVNIKETYILYVLLLRDLQPCTWEYYNICYCCDLSTKECYSCSNEKLENDGFVIISKMGRYSKTPGICKNFKDSRTFAIQVISNGKFKRINLSTLNLARGAIDVKKYDFRKEWCIVWWECDKWSQKQTKIIK